MRRFFICICAAAALSGCVRNGGKEPEITPHPYTFKIPSPPSLMEEAAKPAFVREHFWDNFDFSDSTIPERLDSAAFREHFVNFAGMLLSHPEGSQELMAGLMTRAAQSAEMLDLFSTIAKAVLYEPNSAMRDDILYFPVEDIRSQSAFLSPEDRAAAAAKAQLLSRNRPGTPAEDFNYITIDGHPGSLYALKADYTLIYFNNPGCKMCGEIRKDLLASKQITDLVRNGRMVILGVYPDEDTDLFQAYKEDIPPTWINARDPGCVINGSELYDLKAIPSLYLLDRDKNVILKDCTDVRILDAKLSAQRQ